MSVIDTVTSPAAAHHPQRWRRFTAALPMRTSLVAVGVVWLLGCAWSFQEQSAFAAAKGFTFPHLLPLVIDGFAVSMAGVSWAASLDGRPAVAARLATVVAVSASSASNGAWAYLRAHHDPATVALGVAVPIAANLAFEVLLAELRRQVQRRRGLPPPVAVPYPRLIRLVLAPWQTLRAWRTMVLAITAIEHTPAQPHTTRPDPALSGSFGAASGSAAESAPGIATGPTPQVAGTPTPVPLPLTASASAPEPAPEPAPPAPPQAPIDAAASRTPRQLSKSAARRTPVKAARASAGAVGDASPAAPRASGRPRPRQDPRIAVLAQYLARAHDPAEVTGEQVGQLLSMDIAARTGRRLLCAARELLDQHPTPPPRTTRHPAQRHRRTPTMQDRKYDTSRSELGWAALGLPHTPQNIDNPAAIEAIPAGQAR